MLGWLAKYLRRPGLTAGGRLLALAILAGFLALRIADPQVVEELRLRTFDFYQRISMRPPGPQPVAIVDVDEASLREFGQWPWPRTLIGDLITNIARGGAVAVAFDIIFPEADRTSPGVIARQIRGLDPETKAKLESLESNDQALARAFAAIRAILAQSGQAGPSANSTVKIAETPLGLMGPDPSAFIVTFPGIVQNVPELEAAAAGRGSIHHPAGPRRDRAPCPGDHEGRGPLPRSTCHRIVARGDRVQCLARQVFAKRRRCDRARGRADSDRCQWPRVGQVQQARSQSLCLRRRNSARQSRGAEEASGQARHHRDFGDRTCSIPRRRRSKSVMPGVEIHAQLLENIMSNQLLSRPSYAIGAELVAMVVTAGIIMLLVPVLGAAWVLAIGAAMAAILVGGAFYLFERYGLLFDVTLPLLASLTVYLALVFTNYFREEGRRQQIRSAFSQYLSPAFVEELANNPDKLKLGGETKELSILFMDVRDFTSISERYKQDPQGLTRLMNRLLSPLSNEIVNTKGTIDKYIGDSIMAFWNAPLDDADHAANSCAAALAMATAVKKLNDERRAEVGKQAATTSSSSRSASASIPGKALSAIWGPTCASTTPFWATA